MSEMLSLLTFMYAAKWHTSHVFRREAKAVCAVDVYSKLTRGFGHTSGEAENEDDVLIFDLYKIS